METTPRSTASVYVVGRNELQNRLLASFIVRETGLDCETCQTLKPSSPGENGNGHKHLFLLDGGENEGPDLWQKNLSARRNGEGHLFALFNVDRRRKIEKDAFHRGVKGVFYRDGSIEIISKGVQAILEGELWFPREALTVFLLNQEKNRRRTEPPVQLTFRERQIIDRIGRGASNLEISEELQISIHTVKAHVYKVFKKIGVKSRVQARMWAERFL